MYIMSYVGPFHECMWDDYGIGFDVKFEYNFFSYSQTTGDANFCTELYIEIKMIISVTKKCIHYFITAHIYRPLGKKLNNNNNKLYLDSFYTLKLIYKRKKKQKKTA